MTEHLDLDALADLLVGQAAQDGADREHLSQCADCSGRLAELGAAQSAVTTSLGTLPAPAVPEDVAGRITAALSAQPTLTSAQRGPDATPAAGATVDATVGATVTPLPDRRPARRAWLPAVAASVLLLGGIGLGYSLLSDGPTEGGALTASLGASADRSAGLVRRDSDLDYADPRAVSAALPAVLSGATPEEARRQSNAAPPGAPQPAPGSSGEPLGAREEAADSAEQAADPLRRLRDPAGLASCLVALLPPEQPDVRPLALDYARFRGMPALAVLLPDPDPTKVSVFVVGPECSKDDDDTLFFTRLARP